MSWNISIKINEKYEMKILKGDDKNSKSTWKTEKVNIIYKWNVHKYFGSMKIRKNVHINITDEK